MASRSDADFDGMFSVGNHAELRVERCHTDELGTIDARLLAQAVECIGRQVAILLLYLL